MTNKSNSKRTYRRRGLLYVALIVGALMLAPVFFGKSEAREPKQALFVGTVGNSKIYEFWNSAHYKCTVVESQITYNTSITCK